jgi:hypothetical protein
MRFLAAQWVGILKSGAWLSHARHANRCAALLAERIAAIPGVELMFPRQANSVFVRMAPEAIEAVRARGWHFYTFIGVGGARLMCSWATTEADVAALASDLEAGAAACPLPTVSAARPPAAPLSGEGVRAACVPVNCSPAPASSTRYHTTSPDAVWEPVLWRAWTATADTGSVLRGQAVRGDFSTHLNRPPHRPAVQRAPVPQHPPSMSWIRPPGEAGLNGLGLSERRVSGVVWSRRTSSIRRRTWAKSACGRPRSSTPAW